MINILKKDDLLALEAEVVRDGAVGSYEILYEQMANTFCSRFLRQFRDRRRLLVFAGPGRTGAVALAVARILSVDCEVDSFLLNPFNELSPEVERNRDKLLGSGAFIKEFSSSFHPPVIEESHIVIDGIYGVELGNSVDYSMDAVIDYINQHSKCTVSIDLPSGLVADASVADSGKTIVKAHYTYNFHAPTQAFMLAENARFLGSRETLCCGFDSYSISSDSEQYIFTLSDLDENLSSRAVFSDKRDYGNVALIAGSKGMMGAALLAAKACMRTGAGLLTVHLPQGTDSLLHQYLPEALVREDNSPHCFTHFSTRKNYDAIAVGPGIGQDEKTAKALAQLLKTSTVPLILDADAINILSRDKSMLDFLKPDTILTPHWREMDRLVGPADNDFHRLEKATAFARQYKVYVVLKGAYTATCLPTGAIIYNETGNPGMATAGCGDVLTGMILGLRAQSYDALTSAVFAVFLHGYAADRYAEERSEESLIASDIIDYIPIAFKHFKRNRQF